MIRRLLLASLLLLGAADRGTAGIIYTSVGTTTTITFEGYTGNGFAPIPTAGQLDSDAWAATGWSDGNLAFGGTRTTGDYARGAASSAVTTGGFYAFTNPTVGSAANPAFGIQMGGSDFEPGTLTLQFVNNTGTSLSSITVGYDLFVRNDQARGSTFSLSYASGSLNTPGTFVNSLFSVDNYTGQTTADTLGFVSQRSASTLSTFSFAAPVANGESIFLRWSSVAAGGGGSRDEFALDNISFSAVPEPTSIALLSLVGVGGLALRLRKRIKSLRA